MALAGGGPVTGAPSPRLRLVRTPPGGFCREAFYLEPLAKPLRPIVGDVWRPMIPFADTPEPFCRRDRWLRFGTNPPAPFDWERSPGGWCQSLYLACEAS